MGAFSSKSNNANLIQAIREMDVLEMKSAIKYLNTTLDNVRKIQTEKLSSHDSNLREIMHTRISNTIMELVKSHEDEYLKATLKEAFPNFLAAHKWSKNLFDAVCEKIIRHFFPICVDTWEAEVADIPTKWFQELRIREVPEEINTAIRDVIKVAVLNTFYVITKELKGIDLFRTNKEGDTALILAIKLAGKKHEMERKALRDKNEPLDEKLEMESVEWEKACTELVKLLAQAGAVENPRIDQDATCSFGWSALMWAAATGRTDMVNILLATTAELDFTDRYGRGALYFAAEDGHAKIAKILLDAGANKDIINAFGEKPIDRAFKMEKMELVEMLGGKDCVNLGRKAASSNCFAS